MKDEQNAKTAEHPLDLVIMPLPVRIIAHGTWLCNGPDGQICDWEMSDGTTRTLSMREVRELRAASVLKPWLYGI